AGYYTQAIGYYNRAKTYLERNEDITWLAHLNNSLGVLYYFIGEYHQAIEHLEKAIDLSDKSSYLRIKSAAAAGLGDIYAVIDSQAALSAYNKAQTIAQQVNENFIIFFAKYSQAKIFRIEKNFVMASTRLSEAFGLAQTSGSIYELGLCYLEEGQQALTLEKPKKAIPILVQAAEAFSNGRTIESLNTFIKLAQSYHTIDNSEEALIWLRRAFETAAQLENQHPLLMACLDTRDLLELAQQDIKLEGQANQLLAQISLFQQKLPEMQRELRQQQRVSMEMAPLTPAALHIEAFGTGKILLNHQPLTDKMWTQRPMVRELFFYLLTQPTGQDRLSLAAIFWPDSDTSRLGVQLSNTLYKIRRALNRKEIILLDSALNRYQFNRDVDYVYDVEVFEQHLDKARSIKEPQVRIELYRTGLALYKGDYLPEIGREWAIFERERLSRMYSEANLELSELYFDLTQYQAALHNGQKALAHEPTLEPAHRLTMKIYAAMGNPAAVKRQYEQCQQILQDEISVPISQQTEELYKALTAN
ncbi:MAG: bacterial transcriptional activator domain-containing protein, partial [Chloroflexota bacterium]